MIKMKSATIPKSVDLKPTSDPIYPQLYFYTTHRLETLLQIKKALAAGYFVVASIRWVFLDYDVDSYVLYYADEASIKNCNIGHPVVIVGYDDDKQLFEIRNSCGSDWGNNGYAYIDYDIMQKVIMFTNTYALVK